VIGIVNIFSLSCNQQQPIKQRTMNGVLGFVLLNIVMCFYVVEIE